ncbi:DUF3147 family protein [Candidatus Woesearchaeota archaeon]|nr:DUF3147 family protein [Candidatus Woesearchaeota archaeon]
MDYFTLKLLLSFFIGCFWVIIVTVIAEKYGSKIGGVIAGLPSTSLLTLFFIGLTQGEKTAADAAIVIPFMVGATALFIMVYILLARYNFYLGIISSVILWLAISFFVIVNKLQSLFYSFLALIIFTFISYIVLEKKLSIPSQTSKEIKYTTPQLLSRGILTGTIILMGGYTSYFLIHKMMD